MKRDSGAQLRVGVLGAGAIGCFVGGRLAADGADVILVGRPALADEICTHGLALTDLHGPDTRLPSSAVQVATDVSALTDRDVVLVAVKSPDTAAAGGSLAPHVRARDTLVVSLQNGVRNADVLREALPGATVLAAMVTFNVTRPAPGTFRRATSGPIALERHARAGALVAALEHAGIPTLARRDIRAVLWSKLLFNLNNAINALAGVPLRDELADRRYRRIFAACMREGIATTRAARIRLARIGRLVPALASRLLPWPDAIVLRLASSMLEVDPQARSSMWDDLERRRATEIDWLNGEVVRLGREHGVRTPVNERIIALVREAERNASGSPRLDAAALTARIYGAKNVSDVPSGSGSGAADES